MSTSLSSLSRRQALFTLGSVATATSFPGWASPSEGDIVVGQSLPLSGPAARVFESVVKSQQLALKDVNERGGIHGRKLRLVQLDDGYETNRTVANVSKLIDEHKVSCLFGLASTGGVAEVLPMLAERKVPLIGAYTGSPSLRSPQHPYFFTLTASYRDEVVQMMRNQAALQRTKIGLVYLNNVFGQLMVPVVEDVAREHNISIVCRAPLDSSGTDAEAACDILVKAEPQAVIMMAFGIAMLPFIKSARRRVRAQIYCPSIATSKPLNEALGDDARGLAYTEVMPYPFRTTTAITRDYGAAMAAAKLEVDYDHFTGYLSIRALAAILRSAGKQFTPQSLPGAIERIGRLDLGGYVLEFSPQSHHGSRFVETVVVGPGGRFMR